MRYLFGWFVKLTGFLPQLVVFRRKTYFENRKIQGRRIKGKAIIVSNHLSVWDVANTMFLFPFRGLRTVVAELMFSKNVIFSMFLKALGAIKVERDSQDYSFVHKSVDVLNKGGVVEIYPESRLPIKNEEVPLEFKTSAVYIALLANAPIIPIYTNGKYFSKKRARTIIGTPIIVGELYDENQSEAENLLRITKVVRDKIIGLKDELEGRIEKQKKA